MRSFSVIPNAEYIVSLEDLLGEGGVSSVY